MNLTPGWEIVNDEENLLRLASILRVAGQENRRASAGGTALGAALLYAGAALGEAPACRARTVDISGDGENNEGLGPAAVYRTALFESVTVNTRIVDILRIKAVQPEEIALVAWFQSQVLHGPEAF